MPICLFEFHDLQQSIADRTSCARLGLAAFTGPRTSSVPLFGGSGVFVGFSRLLEVHTAIVTGHQKHLLFT